MPLYKSVYYYYYYSQRSDSSLLQTEVRSPFQRTCPYMLQNFSDLASWYLFVCGRTTSPQAAARRQLRPGPLVTGVSISSSHEVTSHFVGMSVLCEYATAAYFGYCCIFSHISAKCAYRIFLRTNWHFRRQF